MTGNLVDVAVGTAVADAEVELDDSTVHQTGEDMAVASAVGCYCCCMGQTEDVADVVDVVAVVEVNDKRCSW